MATAPILSLNADCLAHTASYLNIHELLYSVAYVCRAFHALAHDPVVWATNVVEPCCDEELLWLSGKFPSIRAINHYTEDEEGDVVLTVLENCGGIVEWDSVCERVPRHGLALTCDGSGNGATSECLYSADLPFISSLRVLYMFPDAGDCFPLPFTNLRELHCSGFFQNSPLTALPLLRKLHTTFDVITPAAWTEFVDSHPHLRYLRLANPTLSVPGGFDAATFAPTSFSWDAVAMPTTLRVFNIVCRDKNTDVTSFGVAVVASSTGLVGFHWKVCAEPSVLAAVASLRDLTALTLHSVDQFSVGDIERCAEKLSLSKLCLPGGADPEKLTAFLAALSTPRRLYPWMLNTVGSAVVLSGRLRWVKEVEMPYAAPLVEDLEILGHELVSLRVLTIGNTSDSYTAEHYAALVPAASGLTAVSLRCAPSHAAPLLRAAAESTQLERVDLAAASVDAALALLEALCDGRRGAPLYRLSFACSPDVRAARVAEAVRAAVGDGALRVYNPWIAGARQAANELRECAQRGRR